VQLPPFISIAEIEQRFHTLLFDAYGVLVNSSLALPGARELISGLNGRAKPYFIVTNGSQLSNSATAKRYQSLGLPIAEERVISSGGLIAPWLRENGLADARIMALGPPTFHELLRHDKINSIVPLDAEEFDVLLVGNQDGFPFVETMDHILSCLVAAIDRGKPPRLLLPNPDLIYPRSRGFGYTAGLVAEVLSAALRIRYPQLHLAFECLGKPHAAIFAEAKKRAGTSFLVLVGDQLGTDIKGARDAGIASVLIGTGVSKFSDIEAGGIRPDYIMQDLK
jgi:HAD superfamily hydrolase (TIGR01450 family)